MKKIYLTFDIEPIVSRLSFNPSTYNHILLSSLIIADELKSRNLKGTFYISLSRKTPKLNKNEYEKILNLTIEVLSHYENIKIEPHLHCYNLPVTFKTPYDQFAKYNKDQQLELLQWAKDYLKQFSIEANSFRPGSYSKNDYYYDVLKESGFQYSSIMTKDFFNIDFDNGNVLEKMPYEHKSGVVEYPVTSLQIKSIKNKKEIINLSPDFLILDSVKKYIQELNYINLNYHSFSMHSNRFARENHKMQKLLNIKYLFIQKPLQLLCKKLNSELIEKNTVFHNELIKWLDYIKEKQFPTYFIGE